MSEKKIDFEDSIKKLDEIANELESDNLSLDESVKKFEEGMKISKQCKKILDETEKKITILIDDSEKDFDINDDE
ncbi:MAG: exodeoxyribonuclease VII small subunit [Clostridia bacterium]|nr:exodeoxyribonuclease VII small subunit [Clostridia bacterium]